MIKRKWSTIFALALGIPLLLGMLAACGSGTTGSGGSSTATTGSATIKIGTELPTSAKDATNGKPAENGAHMAVDQANANHTIPGYTLVLDPTDDVGPSGSHDPTVGAAHVRQLISDALVAGIVGPFNSSVAKADMPIANNAPIAMISPANTNPCLTKGAADDPKDCGGSGDLISTLRPTGKVTYFRIATTDDHQGPAMADYLYKTLGLKTVYVIDDAETYGVGIANTFSDEFKTDGGTLLGRSSEPGTTTSYVSLLTQIASKHPDAIYFGGNNSTGGDLVRQQMLQVPGLASTPIGGGDGIVTSDYASAVPNGKGGAAYGTIATVDEAGVSTAKTFLQQYDQTYGASNLGAYSAAGYDATNIMIQAIKTALAGGAKTPQNASDLTGAASFRQAVINAIQNIQFTGVLGPQSFDKNGDTTNRVVTVYKVGPSQGSVPQSTPGWNPIATVKVGG